MSINKAYITLVNKVPAKIEAIEKSLGVRHSSLFERSEAVKRWLMNTCPNKFTY